MGDIMSSCSKFLCVYIMCIWLVGTACAEECKWQGHSLREVDGESASTSNQLVSYSFNNNTVLGLGKKVKYADVFGDKIIVWYANTLNEPSTLCVYDTLGEHIYSYSIEFSRGNGVTNLSMYGNDILLFVSSTQRIYRFDASGHGIRYYMADPTNFDIFTAKIKNQSFPRINQFKDDYVDIVHSDGTLTTIVNNQISKQQTKVGQVVIICLLISCLSGLVWYKRKCVNNS